MSDSVDWMLINRIVNPEHQYKEVSNAPIEAVRMAWPFKTEEELKILSKWFRTQQKATKEKQIKEHVELYGKALV